MTPQLLLAKSSREKNTKIHHFLGSKLARFRISAAQTAPSLLSGTTGILHRSLTSTLLLFPVFHSDS